MAHERLDVEVLGAGSQLLERRDPASVRFVELA